jgi:hypothetical membrane protein
MQASTARTIETQEKTVDRGRAGFLFVLGSMLFLLLTTAAEAVYPNFSLLTNSISDLAAIGARTMVIEEAAVLGLSICWLFGAYYLFRNTGRRGVMILNMAPGAGFLLAGLSPENFNLVLHSIGALVGFPLGAIAVIMSYRLIHTPLKYFSAALGALSLVATFVTFAGQQIVGPCGACIGNSPGYVQSLDQLILGLGGWESMIIFPFLVWLIGFGSYLLASDNSKERPR